jgi:GNAT superfamily N-acetyltransferase
MTHHPVIDQNMNNEIRRATMIKKTNLNLRPYQNEEDYWRIRAFLRETLLLNERRELNWHVARLDYWRGHLLSNCQGIDVLDGLIYIWETTNVQIAAVLNIEEQGQAYFQVHPTYRSVALETEMIALAEEKFAIERDGQQMLCVWIYPEDTPRREILQARGYSPGKWTESQWRRDLGAPIPEVSIPEGYTIRSLGDIDEIPARSWASWRGFHPDEPDEDYQGWEWYHNIQRCPLYRRDLDIVAVAPSSEIASFCTMWYDDVTRSAYIEPVATVPEYLRRGLARAIITEGLHRLKKMGATCAFVSGYEPAANSLYSSTLSPTHDSLQQWIKKW